MLTVDYGGGGGWLLIKISILLRTYSSFKAALTAGKVSMLRNCPN